MGTSAHSDDLRSRVVAEILAGASRRQAAERFKVSAASAVRWAQLHSQTGGVHPRPRGGKSRSPLEPHAAWLLELITAEPDLTLEAIVQRLLAGLELKTSEAAVRRFFKRHAITFKKTLHAAEQDRPDVSEARERWQASQASLDPTKLVFVDETGANTKMVRAYGRCRRGKRLVCKTPWGHWKTTTFTCGLRCDGLVAPWVLEGPMTGDAFRVYIEKVLVPTLAPGDTVIIDNLASHKVAGVRDAIEAVGAKLLYLPPYSPDLNPIELAFAKFKTGLRRAAERTVDDLWQRIGTLIDDFSPNECQNYLRHDGYASA
ncbi:IS630 family transposase [Bradyrhizobium sp. LB11.1]|uniref:IS630 family transposase n=1 Tax=Bradyrhizobium sp. LB11.1 TaxID=3156326 RepID=UPI003398FCA3